MSKKFLLKSYLKKILIENEDLIIDGEKHEITPGLNIEQNARNYTRDHYKNIFSNPYENIVVFTGAGTSITSGGKSMAKLWDLAEDEVEAEIFKKVYKALKLDYPSDDSEKDLEKFLSQTKMAVVLEEDQNKEVLDCVAKIKKKIKKACDLTLSENSPHLEFLHKLTARKKKYSRIKIFTLNYDLLFEQAAQDGKFVMIDGFSFFHPRKFDPSYFDYDLVIRDLDSKDKSKYYIDKLFHLYKPHGSINWEKDEENEQILQISDPSNPLIIFPNTDKFEQSYEQPFFEMTSRLQRSIRKQNTLLLIIGFSFNDKHFRNVITEATISNPSLTTVVILPNFEEKPGLKRLCEMTTQQKNIILIDEKFEEFVNNYPYPEEYYELKQNTDQQKL